MKLALTLSDQDLPIIGRMKSSLLRRFRPTNADDIEKAIELANYLVILKDYNQAQTFLESFIYLDPKSNHLHLWVTNAQGLLLLVHITRATKQREKYEKYISILEAHDMWPRDIGRLRWYSMHKEEHAGTIKSALGSTHKYKCGIIGQEVLTFMYFDEILLIRETPGYLTKLRTRDLKKILNESKELLIEALTQG